MVAFNFSPEFVDDIAARRKRQTLRRSARARVGDTLQLYTGQRTKDCRKIVDDDPVCIRTAAVELREDALYFDGHRQASDSAESYAQFDGFKNYAEMREWFLNRYGGEIPRLYETRWDWPSVSNGAREGGS
jgi:hypothetical protein